MEYFSLFVTICYSDGQVLDLYSKFLFLFLQFLYVFTAIILF